MKRKKKRGEESQTEISVYIKAKQTNREKKETWGKNELFR